MNYARDEIVDLKKEFDGSSVINKLCDDWIEWQDTLMELRVKMDEIKKIIE